MRQLCGHCVRNLVGVRPGTLEYALNNGFHGQCNYFDKCASGDLRAYIEASPIQIKTAMKGYNTKL